MNTKNVLFAKVDTKTSGKSGSSENKTNTKAVNKKEHEHGAGYKNGYISRDEK